MHIAYDVRGRRCAGSAPEIPESVASFRDGFAVGLDGFMAGDLQHRCVWRR